MGDTIYALVAAELGKMILTYVFPPDWKALADRVDSDAIHIVEEIRAALDNSDLNDFYCLDQIVEIINGSGLGTTRHDFG